MEESKVEEKKEPKSEPTVADKLKQVFTGMKDIPPESQRDAWKQVHGDIFLSALSDDELFVFRAMTRKEHRDLNTRIAEGKMPPEDMESEVVKMCLLWKSIKDLESKAGTIPSLFEQVMQNSNFLAPQMLSNLVTKL